MIDEEQVRESAPRPRVGAPLGSRNAQKQALDTLKLAARKLGTRAIDGRTKLVLMLRDLREKITADLGGKEQLSQAQQILIDDVARLTLWIDSIDGWLLTLRSIVLKRRKTLIPAISQRTALVETPTSRSAPRSCSSTGASPAGRRRRRSLAGRGGCWRAVVPASRG